MLPVSMGENVKAERVTALEGGAVSIATHFVPLALKADTVLVFQEQSSYEHGMPPLIQMATALSINLPSQATVLQKE